MDVWSGVQDACTTWFLPFIVIQAYPCLNWVAKSSKFFFPFYVYKFCTRAYMELWVKMYIHLFFYSKKFLFTLYVPVWLPTLYILLFKERKRKRKEKGLWYGGVHKKRQNLIHTSAQIRIDSHLCMNKNALVICFNVRGFWQN